MPLNQLLASPSFLLGTKGVWPKTRCHQEADSRPRTFSGRDLIVVVDVLNAHYSLALFAEIVYNLVISVDNSLTRLSILWPPFKKREGSRARFSTGG